VKIEILPLDFQGQGALLEPVDHKLHDLAVEYCARELQGGSEINLARFSKVWLALADGEAVGLAGYVYRLDIPVFRVTGETPDRTTKLLTDRLRAFFQDQGFRGQEVLLHISSKERPEQRCAKWQESLKAAGAEPADRFSVKI
jgi:hypothetical protein